MRRDFGTGKMRSKIILHASRSPPLAISTTTFETSLISLERSFSASIVALQRVPGRRPGLPFAKGFPRGFAGAKAAPLPEMSIIFEYLMLENRCAAGVHAVNGRSRGRKKLRESYESEQVSLANLTLGPLAVRPAAVTKRYGHRRF